MRHPIPPPTRHLPSHLPTPHTCTHACTHPPRFLGTVASALRLPVGPPTCAGAPEVVFLDDPFASVDVHTSNHLFDELVLGPSMAGRTRIVAMQPSASRLRRFDRVLLMDGGRIVEAGTPEEVGIASGRLDAR